MTAKLGGPWFSLNMPYALIQLSLPGHVWLPVNRAYKPLGDASGNYVHYLDYAERAMSFKRDPRDIDELAEVWKHETRDKLYLYHDDPASKTFYFARLGRLLEHASSIKPLAKSPRDSMQ